MKPSPARLLRAADLLPEDFADVRGWMEMEAEERLDRRAVLRRCQRIHLWHLARRAAAEHLAQEWANLPEPELCLPDTLRGELDRLRRASVKPLRWRQIFDDLDVTPDRWR